MRIPDFLEIESPGQLWARAVRPRQGFLERSLEGPGLGRSVRELVLLRSPVTLAGMVLSYVGFQGLYARLADPASDFWTGILAVLPEPPEPQALKEALAQLPALPSLVHALPGMVLLAPLVVLSLWLHDATFDHMGLWLLRGLGGRRGFKASLVADAEALKVGVLGALVGLLSDVPGLGLGTTLVLLPVAIYFWVLRGHALAAWHGCPVWKGVTATLLNVVLAAGMVLVLLLALVIMAVLLV